jgi:hypothetical protein
LAATETTRPTIKCFILGQVIGWVNIASRLKNVGIDRADAERGNRRELNESSALEIVPDWKSCQVRAKYDSFNRDTL